MGYLMPRALLLAIAMSILVFYQCRNPNLGSSLSSLRITQKPVLFALHSEGLRMPRLPVSCQSRLRRSILNARAVEAIETAESELKRDQPDTRGPERTLKNGVRIVTSEDSECTMRMDVTVPHKICKKSLNNAVKKLGENVTVPGFRKSVKKSTIPQDLLIGAIGRQTVESHAIESLIDKTVWDALAEVKDEALPKSEKIRLHDKRRSILDHVKKGDDFSYYVIVEVIPEVRWDPHYTNLTIQLPSKNPEEEFAAKRRAIQKKFGEELPVEGRGYASGDMAIVSYEFRHTEENGGGPIFAALGSDVELSLFRRPDGTEVRAVKYDSEVVELMPGVAEAIMGMHEDEEKTISVRIPEDWQVTSASGVETTLTLRVERLREIGLKPLDDSIAPWLASGATNLNDALSMGVEETAQELEKEESLEMTDAITSAVAGAVVSELPERLIFQTAVQMYMDSLPNTRGARHDIESAPTLVQRYIDSNRLRVEASARARLGLRAIANEQGMVADDVEVRERALQAQSMRPKPKPAPATEESEGASEEEEKLEDSKEWKTAKYTIEMDQAVEWLKSRVRIERVG